MNNFNRKTEFWQANTPNKIGPGSYNLVKDREQKPMTAPFASGVKREQNSKKNEIGPGSYLGIEIWDGDVKGAGVLLSGSSRMGPFATGITGFTMPTNVYNPGPGTYAMESISKRAGEAFSLSRRKSLSVDPSPISIPSRERKDASLGPNTYNPSHERVKPSATSTTFGGYLSKRTVFEGIEEGPGPGEYASGLGNGKSFAFPRSDKIHRAKNSNPGPGHYEQPVDRKIRKEPVESFGILAKKDVMFSKDPHMPVQVGYSEVPPVGVYDTEEKLKNVEKLKQKFISYEAPINKPPFNISCKRDMKWVDNPTFPGPGSYNDSHSVQELEEKVAFGSKENKFYTLSTLQIPGPGTYEKEKPRSNSKPSSVFVSKTPRFKKVATDNLSVSVIGMQVNLEIDHSHHDWKAKQARAHDTTVLNPNISFESTADRFFISRKNPNNPGPGYYNYRPGSVSTKSNITGQRYEHFGNFRPKTGTANNVGPGSYRIEGQGKKSFNMSGELSKIRPWIS